MVTTSSTTKAGRNARARSLSLGLAILALAACGNPRDNPAWALGGQPGLLFTIKQYYELNALEENGRCPNPLLEAVTHSRVIQEKPGLLQIDLGYHYRDAFRNGEDRCRRLGLTRCIIPECDGFAERQFVVAKDDDRLKVVEMSGPKRGTVQQPQSGG
jgi:hypothetical protein